MTTMVLCADIGATKTLLGLAVAGEEEAGALDMRATQRYLAAEAPSFEAMVQDFLHRHGAALRATPLSAACLGVAGPVQGNAARMTNLAWRIDGGEWSARLGGIPVEVVNDFHAAASGIDLLPPQALLALQEGEPEHGAPQLVIGAGSGLGVALRLWRGDRHEVVAGEGGHIGFSPLDEEQDLFMRRLRPLAGRVVAEHFVSGPGLANLYLCLGDEAPSHIATANGNAAGLSGEEVFRRATRDGEARASKALGHFFRAYGAVAGDHALASLARGGVYLAGGIAQKAAALMREDGGFIDAFRQKGPYAGLMRTLPVHVVMQPDLGLRGAAARAARIAR